MMFLTLFVVWFFLGMQNQFCDYFIQTDNFFSAYIALYFFPDIFWGGQKSWKKLRLSG